MTVRIEPLFFQLVDDDLFSMQTFVTYVYDILHMDNGLLTPFFQLGALFARTSTFL